MLIKNRLLPLIYALCFGGYLLFGLFNFAYDFLAIKEEMIVLIDEIYTENLKQIEASTFVCVTNDPQLHISLDLTTVKPRTIKYTLAQGGTGEKALYYKTDKQTEFSGKRCLLPKESEEKTVRYILPNKSINCVRLDISSTQGEIIEVENIVINYKPTFIEYFAFSSMDIAKLLILPLLIWAVIKYCIEIYQFYVKKQR